MIHIYTKYVQFALYIIIIEYQRKKKIIYERNSVEFQKFNLEGTYAGSGIPNIPTRDSILTIDVKYRCKIIFLFITKWVSQIL